MNDDRRNLLILAVVAAIAFWLGRETAPKCPTCPVPANGTNGGKIVPGGPLKPGPWDNPDPWHGPQPPDRP